MNRKEIADIITLSGIGGLEKEIKKERNNDFKAWCIILICIIAVNCVILNRNNKETEAKVEQLRIEEAGRWGQAYAVAMDSLVKISQNNGIENCVKKD